MNYSIKIFFSVIEFAIDTQKITIFPKIVYGHSNADEDKSVVYIMNFWLISQNVVLWQPKQDIFVTCTLKKSYIDRNLSCISLFLKEKQ